MSRLKVLLYCDLESQVFGTLAIAERLEAEGHSLTYGLEDPQAIGPALRASLADRFHAIRMPVERLAAPEAAFAFDAVGIYASGSTVFRARERILAAAGDGMRPLLFTGFNGLVYEKFEEGLVWRLGYDLLALNGPRDIAAFRAFTSGTEFSDQPVVAVGLGHRQAPERRPQPGARPLFVFAEQVIVPEMRGERRDLLALLAGLARANPGWDVALKARVRPDEKTFHTVRHHVEDLLSEIPDLPPNLILTYEPLPDLLARAALFATISSTALFEALRAGVPSIVVADFGMKNAHGSHVFFASGLRRTLRGIGALDAVHPPPPNPAWLADLGFAGADPGALVAALRQMIPGPRRLRPAFTEALGVQDDMALDLMTYDRLLARAVGHAQKGEVAAWQEAAARAVAIDGSSTKALRFLAEAHLAAGDAAAARAALGEAARRLPGNGRLRRRLLATWLPARLRDLVSQPFTYDQR